MSRKNARNLELPLTLTLEPDPWRPPALTPAEQDLVDHAIRCLEARYLVAGEPLTSPGATRDYLKLRLHGRPYEVFACLFLDNRHRVLRYEELFRGTLDGASVHPREVVRRVIETRAAAVILAHNHPSGDPTPSRADIEMTRDVADATKALKIMVHDHVIVGRSGHASFKALGLL